MTTQVEIPRAELPTILPEHQTSTTSLVLDAGAFESIERFATLMASSKSTIPAHLRNSPADCMAITIQSMQWGMNPFAVALKTHLVNGTLGYEAQLVSAVIIARAPIKGRPDFEWYGPWEKVIGKFAIKKSAEGKEYRQPNWTMADEEGCGVRVFATLRGEEHPRVLELLLAQARTRNSTLWADDPRQQLAYLAIKRWSRLYTPDVILGVYTPDELDEIGEKDITPARRPVTGSEAGMQSRQQAEQSAERDSIVQSLRDIAMAGDMTALSQAWETIGKDGRRAVGGEEWSRIKDMASESTPPVTGELMQAGDDNE